MEHLFLTGTDAAALAQQLLHALNVPFSGYCLKPFSIAGQTRGEALHFLLPCAPPRLNDVPCRIRMTQGQWLLLPQVMEEIAAPGLYSALSMPTPMLVSSIHADMLRCAAFCDALMQVQAREQLAIFVVEEDAVEAVQQLLPPKRQRWFDLRDTTLDTLVEAATLRL